LVWLGVSVGVCGLGVWRLEECRVRFDALGDSIGGAGGVGLREPMADLR
jgi:hypothetical protein